MKQLIEITKKKLGYRYDREIAEALNMTKSGFSQKISRGDFPFSEIRQLLKNIGVASDWLDAYETEMNKADSTINLNSEVQLLKEKERTITIQQSYIERLEKTIERLEEDKKKWIPTIAPELINQSNNWVNQ
jgi:FtsZ-binding cell division protein ZapB